MFSLRIWVFAVSVFVQTYGFTLNDRIAGGELADIQDFPHQISLQAKGSHWCGGSLLKKDLGLTAAHCTTFPASNYAVRAGSNVANSGGELVRVSEIIKHPNYNPTNDDYDAAILKIEYPLSFGSTIRLQPMNQEVPIGVTAIVTGWGFAEEGESFSDHLRKTTVVHIRHADCVQAYLNLEEVTDRMFCYASPGKDACQGDSGGPLIYSGYQIGIISWGYSCADPRYPGVYTKTSDSGVQDFVNQYLV